MKIAIAGYGVEGKASYDYYASPENELVIVDERGQIDAPVGAKVLCGPDALAKLHDFDLIIRSPSVAPAKLPYPGKVWSVTNEFFKKCAEKHVPIIGVTGTKGKGTTSSLITSILRAAGHTVHLVGNIGTPAIEILPRIQSDDIVVYELSSFQLWDAQYSPHVAVVLGIEPDHLDVHDSMIDYISAKTRIVAHQTTSDTVVFNKDNRAATAIGEVSRARKVLYPFAIDKFASSVKLPGQHNLENAAAAIAAVGGYVTDAEAIKAGLAAFTGLPHRLKFVAEKHGVKYYDDSIATTPGSAIAAINAFNERVVLILGGREKGGDMTELMKLCHAKQATVIAIGENRQKIAELCTEYDVNCEIEPGDMPAIVQRAATTAEAGSVVVLSPAAASFDMFKSYADRGEQFIAAVEVLK